tara:strand:+ start:146 stop:508 length:363 start_codon:yes stop_codon:yes gene_type:complete
MSGLIGAGQFHRQQATLGLGQAAEQEAQHVGLEMQQEAAERAAEMQLYGTALGIGGSIGAAKVIGGSTAAAAGAAGAGAGAGAAAAGTSAAATAGTTLAAIAPPVAIALGVAYLLNKIFD